MKTLVGLKTSKARMILLAGVDILTIVIDSLLCLLIVWHEAYFSMVLKEHLSDIVKCILLSAAVTLLIFVLLHLYRSVWTFAGLHEVTQVVAACFLSAVSQLVIVNVLLFDIPKSYYVCYFFLLTMTTITTRFSYRIWITYRNITGRSAKKRVNTMVIGAGEAGSMIIHELQTSRYLSDRVVCAIDDNPSKKGKYLHGVKIVGNRDAIISCAKRYNIDEIIVAIPTADAKDKKEILKICSETSCKLKVLPGMYQLISGEVSVSKLRDVSIDDLLGRDAINVDLDSVAGYVTNKTVLVTGGGGSIGSELCRQIANYKPKCLIIFDIYENNAYEVQQELKKKHPELNLKVLIGSVRNTKRIESVMELYRPDVVYHAAAHKHVPLMEDSPNEAVKNNVFGTYKTARAADKYGVRRFVLISTDKAVNPTNVMGATKRICEMIIQTFAKYSKTEYVAVRFGNVLGSNGSVIPLFKKQMEAGGPVTVTHPDIIRFFMTIPEAVSLVLQAGAYAKGGEIFVLDMGEPVKIADLAKNLIRLSGYTLGVDMEIEYTGLRPGEKLYEEVLAKEEGLKKTENNLIYIGEPLQFDEVHFMSKLRELDKAAVNESFRIKELVSEIVPTYHIRQEDKERDEKVYEEFCKLGRASQDGPAI